MTNGRGDPKVVTVEGIKVDQFPPGTQLTIFLDGRPTFIALVDDPQKSTAVVRPAVPGQAGAGFRDALSTLGSRPFQEGSKSHTSKEEDSEIKWGEMVFGDELVLRNEDKVLRTDGNILYTGLRITSVAGPEV